MDLQLICSNVIDSVDFKSAEVKHRVSVAIDKCVVTATSFLGLGFLRDEFAITSRLKKALTTNYAPLTQWRHYSDVRSLVASLVDTELVSNSGKRAIDLFAEIVKVSTNSYNAPYVEIEPVIITKKVQPAVARASDPNEIRMHNKSTSPVADNDSLNTPPIPGMPVEVAISDSSILSQQLRNGVEDQATRSIDLNGLTKDELDTAVMRPDKYPVLSWFMSRVKLQKYLEAQIPPSRKVDTTSSTPVTKQIFKPISNADHNRLMEEVQRLMSQRRDTSNR